MDRDELLARIDLPALLDALSGPCNERHRWRCPAVEHPDRHPSVTVQVGDDGIARWRCWSGGHRGTALDAVIVAHRVDVGTAMRWLADHTGTWRPAVAPVATSPDPSPPVGKPAVEVLRYVHNAAKSMWSPAGRPQREWLASRGLAEPVLRANRVGADPGRRFLPRPKGFPAGWPAVVYPALDPTGEVAYFQARYIDPPQGRSKYDNPARRWAANPRLAWTTPPSESRTGVLVVCEGPADALVAAQAGFPAVGVLGSSYPDRRIADTLAAHNRRSTATVIVCFDADDPGRAGAARLADLLGECDVPTVTVTPPDGLDLGAWALQSSAWIDQLDTHRPLHQPTAPPALVVSSPDLSNREITVPMPRLG